MKVLILYLELQGQCRENEIKGGRKVRKVQDDVMRGAESLYLLLLARLPHELLTQKLCLAAVQGFSGRSVLWTKSRSPKIHAEALAPSMTVFGESVFREVIKVGPNAI